MATNGGFTLSNKNVRFIHEVDFRCVEAIKESSHSHLADDLEINKAILYLRQKNIALATETLKTFEKRANKMASNAAVNLSTIHYLVRI